MKKQLIKGIPILFFCLLLISSDTHNPNYFYGLMSKGEAPSDFFIDLSKSQQIPQKAKVDLKGKDLEKFWLSNRYFMNRYLAGGEASYGNEVSNYLNAIKDHLLKDDTSLKNLIRIYVSSSPSVNAFANQLGIVVINVGLIARAKTESEIAFIVAHEIAHVMENHGIETFSDRKELEKSREYKRLWGLEKLDVLTSRSKNHELEADRKGFSLFLNSKYAIDDVGHSLNLLSTEFAPFEQMEIKSDFFPLLDIAIPTVHIMDEVEPLVFEENYFDANSTHPNLKTRREEINKLMPENKKGVSFLQEEALFNEIRKQSRLEVIKQEIENRSYGNALYHSLVLMDIYGSNKYYEMAIGKTLLGLTAYKMIDQYDQVARPFRTMKGESQRIHYFIRQLDKRQLSAIALRYMYELEQKYPADKKVKILVNKLAMHVSAYGELTSGDFTILKKKDWNVEFKLDDYSSEREKIRAEERHYKSYYNSLVQDQITSGWLDKKLDRYEKAKDSIRTLNYANLEYLVFVNLLSLHVILLV